MSDSETARPGQLARFFYELSEGARRQGNVLFALIFKELKARAGNNAGRLYNLAMVMLEPAIGALLLAGFWYIIGRYEVGGVHVALFVAVSYTPFSIFRRSMSSIPRSLRSNLAFYAYQQVKPFDSITAQFVIELTLTVIGGALLLFGLWWFLGLSIQTDRLLELMGAVGLMLAISFGVSLTLGVYGTFYPVISSALGAMSRGLLLLCAVMHPMEDLPVSGTYYLSFNPIAHLEEMIRLYALGIKPFAGVSLAYPSYFALGFLFLGFASYYANRRKVLER